MGKVTKQNKKEEKKVSNLTFENIWPATKYIRKDLDWKHYGFSRELIE